MSLPELIIFCAGVGALAGFMNGLAGLGGAFIIVPSLDLLFTGMGMTAHTAQVMAIGSTPLAMLLSCLSGFLTHNKHGNVRKDILKKMWLGILIGGILGAWIATLVSAAFLKLLFAFFLFGLGGMMLMPRKINEKEREHLSFLGIGGFLFGLISALTGIAGTMLCLTWLNWRGVSWRQATGTSAGLGLITTFTSTCGFILTGFNQPGLPEWSLGYVYLPGIIIITIPGIIMAWAGARLLSSDKIPVQLIKKVFAIFIICLAIKIAWPYF